MLPYKHKTHKDRICKHDGMVPSVLGDGDQNDDDDEYARQSHELLAMYA